MSKLQKILVLLLISLSIQVKSQVTIELDSVNGQVMNGTELIIDTIPTGNINLPHMYFTNTTGNTENWMITRRIIAQPDGWFNYLCWGELCYGLSEDTYWNSSTSSINDTETEELTIYVGAPDVGNAHYRYYVSSDGINYIDSVDVIVNVTSTTGVNESIENNVSIFPNPVKNNISINGLQNDEFQLSIYTSSGSQVYQKRLSENNNINISNLKNGQYVFILKSNKNAIQKQIIIQK
jgi:hypothetical protein